MKPDEPCTDAENPRLSSVASDVRWHVLALRTIVLPLLIVLVLGAIIPLTLRQLMHRLTWCFDEAVDRVARFAGYDPNLWPLPKASDDPLPWQ